MTRVCTSKGDNEKSCAIQGSDRKMPRSALRGDFVGNGGVLAMGGQHTWLGVIRAFLFQQGIHFFMRDIDPFRGHHALRRQSLRTRGSHVPSDEQYPGA